VLGWNSKVGVYPCGILETAYRQLISEGASPHGPDGTREARPKVGPFGVLLSAPPRPPSTRGFTGNFERAGRGHAACAFGAKEPFRGDGSYVFKCNR
jgi:hypothetical protein